MWRAPSAGLASQVPSGPLTPRSLGGLVAGRGYPGVGSGHWVSQVMDRGRVVKLEDGSLWEVAPLDRLDSALWLPVTDITVTDGDDLLYPYKLINTDDHEVVNAKLLGH